MAGPDGRVTALNRAARRMLGTSGDPRGRDYREVLPLVDSAGADWWSFVSPYRGFGNRTGHPERLLELRDSGRCSGWSSRSGTRGPAGAQTGTRRTSCPPSRTRSARR